MGQVLVDGTEDDGMAHARTDAGTSDDGSVVRVFAPEAHLPRTRRLIIGPMDVVLEVGIGVQHRFTWADCDAVLRFPDRLELVFGQSSLVIRASDWFHGSEALQLADQLMPSSLRVEVPTGEAEPDPVPYKLYGLARSSSVVLGVTAFSCAAVAAMAIGLGVSNRRSVAVLIGLLFCIPIRSLVEAIRRRRAVPQRWRIAAAQASRHQVNRDALLAAASDGALWAARVGLPLGGVVLAFGWWTWTGTVPIVLVLLGAGLGVAADVELQRRHHR